MTKSLAPIDTLRADLHKNSKRIGALMRADVAETSRYLAEVTEAISANPKLLAAHRPSLIQAIGTAASMNLSILPQLGEAWIIPRARKIGETWRDWANFQIGYKGLIKLGYRSGVLDSLFVEVAYTGEPFEYLGGTSHGIYHKPDLNRSRRWEDIEAAYAVAYIKGSSRPIFAPVGKTELADVRASTGSKASQYREAKPYTDVWRDHPEAMSKKTALIRLAKLLPRVDELRTMHIAAAADEGRSVLSMDDIELSQAEPTLAERVMSVEQVEPADLLDYTEADTADPHARCSPTSHCGAADCPGAERDW